MIFIIWMFMICLIFTNRVDSESQYSKAARWWTRRDPPAWYYWGKETFWVDSKDWVKEHSISCLYESSLVIHRVHHWQFYWRGHWNGRCFNWKSHWTTGRWEGRFFRGNFMFFGFKGNFKRKNCFMQGSQFCDWWVRVFLR